MGLRSQVWVVAVAVALAGCAFDSGGYGLTDPGSEVDAGATPPTPTPVQPVNAGMPAPMPPPPMPPPMPPQPTGPLPFMSMCRKGSDCASELCVQVHGTGYCTVQCNGNGNCPAPSTGCSGKGDEAVCLP